MNLIENIRTFINNLLNRGQAAAGPQPPQTLAQKLSFSRHHLLYFGLVFGVLGAILLWQSFGAPAPVVATVEAENMQLPDGARLITSRNASAGRAVVMTKNGTLTSTGALNSDSATIAIRAYGGRCQNVWPKIDVSIDDRKVFSMDVSASSWHDFERDLRVTKGTHKLSISLTNGTSGSSEPVYGVGGVTGGCLRTLYLDKITFFGQPATDPPPVPAPPPPASPTLNFSANPTSVARGGSSTLNWSTTNADICIASGAWSGTKAVSGSESTGALSTSQTYTLTCSGAGGSVNRSVTVTVTSTPAPPPPPTPPPPSANANCLVSNRTSWGPTYERGDCRYGTILTFTNEQFRCSQPLSNYGQLPLLLRWNFTANPNFGDQGHLDFLTGCRGDGNSDTIDVIVESNADGIGVGACGGAGKFRTAPVDIQITGIFNSGPLCGGAHQDVWQFHPAHPNARLDIVNGVSGNWNAGTSTTIGAGGAIFFSNPYDVDVYGGRYVTCNHGYFGSSSSSNQVIDAGFRTGRNDGTDPKCTPYSASDPCQGAANFQNVICERWIGGRWVSRPPN